LAEEFLLDKAFGEYFSNHLLNETTTVIGLESNGKERKRNRKRRKKTNRKKVYYLYLPI